MKRRGGAAATDTLQRLELRVEALEAALQARDDFIATVGHELKNPLTPVYLQLQHLILKLQRQDGPHIPVTTVLPKLEAFAGRLDVFLRTLDRILDVSRISSGRIDLQYETLDLAEVVQGVAQSMQREFDVALTSLQLHLSPAPGRWDRLRLEQICHNLLSNALRYGLANPVEVHVRLEESEAVLVVADTGMGIAPEDHETIFERFDRGSVTPRTGGFGVGLWIVKKICDAFAGEITVRSTVGRGSTFVVRLPCVTRENL